MGDIIVWLELFQCVAVIMAGCAIFFQWRSAKKATEVTAYMSLIASYGKPEMKVAIARLADFGRENSRNHIDNPEAFELLARSDSEDLKNHLRVVGVYFSNVARLYGGGFISKKLARILINHPGLNIYYEITVPIDMSRYSSEQTKRDFDILKKVLVSYGNGFV